MVAKKVAKVMAMPQYHKGGMLVVGLVAIALGIWAWMSEPTLVQLVAVLLVLMGIKKLIWASRCC